MLYGIYKFHFTTPVRFGSGSESESQMTFHADTLFSALYLACMEAGKEAELLSMVNSGMLRFSDALPFRGDTLYLPRPIGLYSKKLQTEIDASSRKLLKKLAWVPANLLSDWLQGKASPSDLIVHFGVSEERTRVNRREEIPLPYPVQCFRFFDDCGLYVIVSAKSEAILSFMDEAMTLLSASGIGGSVTSGWGHFHFEQSEPPQELHNALDAQQTSLYMLLSVGFPAEEEAKVMEGARYLLVRRSGFTAGHHEKPIKKKTSWLLAPGSVFTRRFDGIVEDVAISQSPHPVWRCAKALMMGVNVE